MITKIASHYDSAATKIICQYWSATNWKACLKAVMDQLDGVENTAWDLAYVTDFMGLVVDIPVGLRLDFVGGLIGLDRDLGETDNEYYLRLLDYINLADSGTIEGILRRAKAITGDQLPLYVEENHGVPFCASGVLFTQSERQVTRAEANKIKAAGTRLFIGGLIKFSESDVFLKTPEGQAILLVGGPYVTYKINTNIPILDELSGLKILDESNENFFIVDEV